MRLCWDPVDELLVVDDEGSEGENRVAVYFPSGAAQSDSRHSLNDEPPAASRSLHSHHPHFTRNRVRQKPSLHTTVFTKSDTKCHLVITTGEYYYSLVSGDSEHHRAGHFAWGASDVQATRDCLPPDHRVRILQNGTEPILGGGADQQALARPARPALQLRVEIRECIDHSE